MDKTKRLYHLIKQHSHVQVQAEKSYLIKQVLKQKEALAGKQGFLYTVTPPESTGRSPKDTYIVRNPRTDAYIDWDSPNNIPLEPDTFDMLWDDALIQLKSKKTIYVTERTLGSDPTYIMPVQTVTDRALTALFTMNMFRPVPENISESFLSINKFILLVLPYDKLDPARYQGRLRQLPGGTTSNMAIVMDFANHLGLIIGSAYGGSVKKLMFTVMNYYLPFKGVLPLHCAASQDASGNLFTFLGLSGTGKTSLSADTNWAILGDDEHGWSNNGIANFENGCYAKLINLDPQKEPEIHHAVFHKDWITRHGVIVENAMIYPDGGYDMSDDRLTPNSRASYPLTYLRNVKHSAMGPHPKNIFFLTADANGVLPPVARLNREQARYWFLMGYTSKLAGTETGIIEPKSVFSRFFGQPFMPLIPEMYLDLLDQKLKKHRTQCYLINTGWTGGPFGIGRRMDITLTRSIIKAIVEDRLEHVEMLRDQTFHFEVPRSCPGIPDLMLCPKNTWQDPTLFDTRSAHLADEFCHHFSKAYGGQSIVNTLSQQCPGRIQSKEAIEPTILTSESLDNELLDMLTPI